MPAPNEKDIWRIVRGVRDLFEGRGNHVGSFTMTVDAGSTTVVAPNCGETSKITITPKTSAAATEFGAGTWYISAVGPGTFTIVHVNSATAGRTFDYSIQG